MIEGAKKGAGNSFSETPDSLRTTQYAKILDLLCEGEIEGLANGERSIFLDSTPLMNSDGSRNFKNVVVDYVTGTPDQKVLSMASSVYSTVPVGTKVLNGYPIEHTIQETDADYVAVGISIPQLARTDSSNGNVYGSSVTYTIDLFDRNNVKQTYGVIPSTNLDASTGKFTPSIGASGVRITAQVVPAMARYETERGEKGRTVISNSFTATSFRFQLSTASSGWYDVGSPVRLAEEGFLDATVTVQGGVEYYARVVSYGYEGDITALPRTTVTGAVCLNTAGQTTVSGKASSQYINQHLIKLVGEGPWRLKVTRDSANSSSSLEVNDMSLAYVTRVYLDKLNYPYSAIVGLTLDATQFSSIPKRTYDVKLLRVKVPSNYDPISRKYTGIWDGSFVVKWTDNPAWCFYDLVTNKRYGLGDRVPPELVDKFALYAIGKYCDELVEDGFGGVEPRFTCNILLNGQEEAYRVVNDFVSIFRGMVYWHKGGVFAVQDSPRTPLYLFNNTSVEGGVFNYTSSPMNTRYNVALVSWKDQSAQGVERVEYVSNDADIKKYGAINSTEIVAVGCTSRGQARRVGKWLLYTNSMETDVVEFTVGLDGLIPLPGDVIAIFDTLRAGIRLSGRLLNYDANTLTFTLDSSINFLAGKKYKITYVDSRGKFSEVTLNDPVGLADKPVSKEVLEFPPTKDSPFIISTSDIVAAQYRVTNIQDNGEGKFTISAVSYNASKYAHIENGEKLDVQNTSALTFLPTPPKNVVVDDDIMMNNLKTLVSRIRVRWDAVSNVRGYVVSYRMKDGNWASISETRSNEVYIEPVADKQVYQIKVESISSIGVVSPNAKVIEYTPLGKTRPPSNVTGFFANVSQTGVLLKWNSVSDIDLDYYEIRKGNDWDSATSVAKVYADNFNLGYSSSARYLIKAVDNTGNFSVQAATVDVVVNLLSAPVIAHQFLGSTLALSWSASSGTFALSHYLVEIAGIVHKVNGTSLNVAANWLSSRVINITPYDTGGNAGAKGSISIAINPPSKPSVQWSISNGLLTLSWAPVSSTLSIAGYEIVASGIQVTSNGTTYSVPVNFSGTRAFKVCAVDVSGNKSGYDEISVQINPPSKPTVSYQIIGSQLVISWAAIPGTLPVSHYTLTDNTGSAAKLDATTVSKAIDWAGSRQYTLTAFDTAGNASTASTITVQIDPAPATTATYSISGTQLVISWHPVRGTLDTSHYTVTVDGLVSLVKGTSFSSEAKWTGQKVYTVQAVDIAGNPGTPKNLTVGVSASPAPTLSTAISNNILTLNWAAVQGTFQTDKYVVSSVGMSIDVKGTSTSIPVTWLGTRTFTVTPYDVNGVVGTPASIAFTVSPPPAPSLQARVAGSDYILSWQAVQGTLSTASYNIYRNGVFVTSIQGLSYSAQIDFSGATFQVEAVDIIDNKGPKGEATVSIKPPTTPTVTAQVIDNNVLLKWSESTGTLPVRHYQIRKGESWESGSVIGTVQGTFTSVFETRAGTYAYYIAAVDTAGNYGSPGSVSASVNQPPDYVLNHDYTAKMDSGFIHNGTYDRDTGAVYLPFKTKQIFDGMRTNGPSEMTRLVYGKGYDGKLQTLLKTVTKDVDKYEPQGGFDNDNSFPIDANKPYIFTVPVYLDEQELDGGYAYFGINSQTVSGFDGVVNDNPYFAVSRVPGRKWFLFVGVVLPKNSQLADYPNIRSGVYDIESGNRVLEYNTFRWAPNTTSIGLRGYSFYTKSLDSTVYFGEVRYRDNLEGLSTLADILQKVKTPVYNWNHYESYSEHFLSNGWPTPQDQVNSGHSMVLGKATGTGTYYEVIDYGTLMGSTKISVTPTFEVISGSPSLKVNIYVKASLTERWKVFENTTGVYASGFRYCKVEVVVSSPDSVSFGAIRSVNIRLDKKLLNDAGSVVALASDTNGTQVNFNHNFVDVISITLSANKQSAVIPVYDFRDEPNPKGFRVYLYDLSGNRTSGEISWGVKGV